MADNDARLRCPWCTTRVNSQASICHGCGAIRTRAPLSMVQLFFLFPLAAFALMLAGLGGLGLPVIPAAALFVVAWTIFGLAHIVMRLRPRWMQVEPLVLEDGKNDAQLGHQTPVFAPWWAGAATVAVGLALIWAVSARSGVEPANASVILALAPAGSTAPAPINVAAVEPPRVALPPKSAPASQMASAEPPKATTIDAIKAESVKAEATKAETAKAEALKTETAKAEAAKTEAAKMQTAAVPPVTVPTATAQTATAQTATTQTATVDAAKAEMPADAQVLTTQRLLAELGYLAGSPDGKMSASTRAAIREFRADMALKGEAIDARFIAELQSVASSRQQAESRRAQQKRVETRPAEPRRVVEARQPEPRQAEMRQAETRRYEPRQAETRQYESRPMAQPPMQQQASAAPLPASAPPSSLVVVFPPPPPPAVIFPPPLSVLNGLSAARNASQVQDQAPVRLAPIRLH